MPREYRYGKLIKAGSIVPDVMLLFWDIAKKGFGSRELEKMSLELEWPYCDWARKELVARDGLSKRRN